MAVKNRIVKVTIQSQRLTPLEAELWFYVEVTWTNLTTEIRGRLHGPKCPGIETIQIAYSLRTLPQVGDTLVSKVVIPEPNAWTKETPFVYEGVIELWEENERCDAVPVTTRIKLA